MPSSFGYRARTRQLYAKGFRQKGMPNLSTYLKTYRLGDIVDIKANSAIQKGMPHKYYHGKTGRVFNVTRRAIGVIVNKRVNTRIVPKRILVRIEHVHPSKSREEFRERVRRNEAKKKEAKEKGIKLDKSEFKRQPKMPAPGCIVKAEDTDIETIRPLKHVDLF